MSLTSPDRTRQLALLDSAALSASGDPTPVLLCAPAGYGKTKLISAWLESRRPPGVVRLRCVPDSQGLFWRDLSRAITRHLGLNPLPGEGSRAALLRLVAELEQPLTLVIDDYHFTTTRENDMALLDLIGPQLRLIVVARRVCLLDGPLAARRVPMLCVAREDLALTPAESRAHAAARFNAAPGPDTETAIELAAGWPLAVRAAFAPTAAASGSLAEATAAAGRGSQPLDPPAALNRFALHHLESLEELPQRILLAASQVDAIDLDQAVEVGGATVRETWPALHQLLEFGLLLPAPTGDTEEFACHPAIARGIAARAERVIDAAQRSALRRGRAEKIAHTTPLTALGLFLEAEAYADAELVLSRHFTTITDETLTCTRMLRALPQEVLRRHPTFIAARMYLELPDTSTSPDALELLTALWLRSLSERLARDEEPGEMRFGMLTQAMVAARLTGDIATANRLSHELEAQFGAAHLPSHHTRNVGHGARRVLGSGSLPQFYRELATTALMAGEYDRARRNWQRLRTHAERLIHHPWSGFPPGNTRTVTDVESGRLWLLTALNEMAFTELLDGDVTLSRELLAEADELSQSIGSRGNGLTWVPGEIARAHLSSEVGDEAALDRAIEALSPYSDRIEQWPLLVTAQAVSTRASRGIDWALPQFEAARERIERGQHPVGRWESFLNTHHAMLNTIIGRFGETDRLLDRLPEDGTVVQLERARRALFAGDNVSAVLLAQRVGDVDASLRQRLDRSLIVACAAWGCGQTDGALESLREAAGLLERYGIVSRLRTVPYATLVEITEAARGAGIADITGLVAAVPAPARAKRYEPLTEMELRTLRVVSRTGATNAAAEELFVTPGTIKKHLNSVYRKLDVRGRDEALLQAGRMGLVDA